MWNNYVRKWEFFYEKGRPFHGRRRWIITYKAPAKARASLGGICVKPVLALCLVPNRRFLLSVTGSLHVAVLNGVFVLCGQDYFFQHCARCIVQHQEGQLPA